MAQYTANENLYKWSASDTKQTTITETALNAEKIDGKLNDHTAQLASNTNYLLWNAINVKIPFHGLAQAKGDGVTDDTAVLQAIIDYAYDNKIGRVFLPSGTYVITKPLYVWGTFSGNDPITVLHGDSSNTTTIKKTTHGTLNDGSGYANIDAVLILANKDKNTANDTCGQIINDIHLEGRINGSDIDRVEYGIHQQGHGAYQKVENLLIHANTGVQYVGNIWQSQWINVVAYVKKKGISMLATGTSNYLEKCFMVGSYEIAYELKGNYSTASSITAQWNEGVVFDISWGDWSINGIGEEDSGSTSIIMKTQEANVTLSGVTIFGNTSATSTVLRVDNNSTLTINGGHIGLGNTSLGKLYETEVNAKLILNNVDIKDTYTLSSVDGAVDGAVTIKNDHSTPINLFKGRQRPYMGVNRRRRKYIDYFNTTPKLQGKAIFLSCKDHPYNDTDGTNLEWESIGNTGDIFLVDDPMKKGVLGWVVTSDTSASNGSLRDCTFAPIPIALSGTTAQRTTSPILGSIYYDTDISKWISWNGSKWVDYSNVDPANAGWNQWSLANQATYTVTFGVSEGNDRYTINVAPRWNTGWWISSKTATGFTITWTTPPTIDSQFDWSIKR